MNSKTFQTDNMPSAQTQTRGRKLISLIRIAVGALFAFTGVAKLFILPAFSDTVGQLLSGPGPWAGLTAIIVIGIEIVCGVGLVLNKLVRPSTLLLAFLTVTFLYILTIAIIGHRTFVCHCFGVIPFSLSNSGELVLNFILFDLLILLYTTTITPAPVLSKGRKWVTLVWILVLLYGEASAAIFIMDRDTSDNPVNIIQINNYLASQTQELNGNTRFRHIVLVRISDFNCPPCFNDFVGFSETIRQYYDPARDGSRLIGMVERSEPITDTIALHAWARANNIVFPLILVPDSIFTRFNFTKSCIVYQQPHGMLRSVYTFPGSESGRIKLLSAFTE